MTVKILIDDLTSWAEDKLCKPIKFKRAAAINTDATYEHELVTPKVFAMFLPDVDRLPVGVEDIYPSICLQWDGDDERPQERKSQTTIRLNLGIWNPGEHSEDIIAESFSQDGEIVNKEKSFTRDALGWGDIVNWIDLIKRELRNNDIICEKYRVRLEDGIRSGFRSEQGTIFDYWPFYFGFVEFNIEYGNTQAKTFNNLL